MRLNAVLITLIINFLLILPAQATSGLCGLVLQQVGFFSEVMAEATGRPLLGLNGAEAKVPYSRTYSLVVGANKEPVQVAVIDAKEYSLALEKEIKDLGYLGIAIRNPDEATIAARTDFILTPDWIRTVMPTPASVDAWLAKMNSQDRYDMKKKLSKSERVRTEIADLNWADYEQWRTELFSKEIMTRNGAVEAWKAPAQQAGMLKAAYDPNLPLETQKIPDMKRIFFYSDTGKLIGGSLVHVDKLLRVRGAAFEAQAKKDLQIAFRGFVIAMQLAIDNGSPYISYGDDPGIYGIDSSTGLLAFKASLGMQIVPSPMFKSSQLIKLFPEAMVALRENVPQGAYSGMLVVGIPGDDPDRIQKFRQMQEARSDQVLYEDRVKMAAASLIGIQIGADQGSNALKTPKGIELRRIP